jgi:hypothetical protein
MRSNTCFLILKTCCINHQQQTQYLHHHHPHVHHPFLPIKHAWCFTNKIVLTLFGWQALEKDSHVWDLVFYFNDDSKSLRLLLVALLVMVVMLDVFLFIINVMLMLSLYSCMLYTYICCLPLNIFLQDIHISISLGLKTRGSTLRGGVYINMG